MSLLKAKDPYTVYIFTSFTSAFLFTFIFTVNLLYHVQIVELTLIQLVLVGTVLELTVFLFEIPTGLVADLKSRKLSIVIGYVLIGTGFLLEGLFPLFLTVLLSQILWGVGYTFTSGAGQAWIADEIGEEKSSLAFIKGARAGNLGRIIAIPISILIGYQMINYPIIIGGLGMIGLAIILHIFMKEDNFKPAPKEERQSSFTQMKDSLRNVIKYSKASLLLRILLLIGLLFGLYSEGIDRLWISHMKEFGNLTLLTDSDLVLFTGGVQFIIVLVTFIALHFISKSNIYSKLKAIYIALFIGSTFIIVSLLGFAFSTFIISLIICYIILEVSRATMEPLTDVWLNRLIKESNMRATFFSIKGQVDAIGQIGSGPIIGSIAETFMTRIALVVSAIILSPVLLLYYVLIKKDRAKE
ncbi:MFS transporter [Ornithinibacillus halotolerans]|uniref:Tetracycline efflux MFS transporter TetA(P) n=1 Tax=Ornithinibacillus halotolerans TaxID=1274357 RepID=A0A916RVL3_9BACI|nr:MFS transporter [Ornithinibacillus halotolerans]GGA72259.1 tetracycline efflux MFS transporter TetA(P) [Ornithinibacillus halotolerans]